MGVRRILLRDLNLHPHKLQDVPSLSDRNKDLCLQLRRHFQEILPKNPDLSNNLLMGDEARFHLHGTVNNQTFRDLPTAKPHDLHHSPL
jgi:hypothetical protein